MLVLDAGKLNLLEEEKEEIPQECKGPSKAQ